MEEYYIRNKGDDDSRGPFNLEQLATLVEAGQVTRETMFYDIDDEVWKEIGESESLLQELFPEKKKLKVKPKENIANLNKPAEGEKPVTVEDMLAAAEGNTTDPPRRRDLYKQREKAALAGLNVCALLLALSAAALLLPHTPDLLEGKYSSVLLAPTAIIGAIDLLLAVILFLQTPAPYPFVRLRAALGLGFFLFLAWALGDPWLMVAFALLHLAVFALTLLVSMPLVITTAAIGIAGAAGVLYLAVF